jgi:hypothetical protein
MAFGKSSWLVFLFVLLRLPPPITWLNRLPGISTNAASRLTNFPAPDGGYRLAFKYNPNP